MTDTTVFLDNFTGTGNLTNHVADSGQSWLSNTVNTGIKDTDLFLLGSGSLSSLLHTSPSVITPVVNNTVQGYAKIRFTLSNAESELIFGFYSDPINPDPFWGSASAPVVYLVRSSVAAECKIIVFFGNDPSSGDPYTPRQNTFVEGLAAQLLLGLNTEHELILEVTNSQVDVLIDGQTMPEAFSGMFSVNNCGLVLSSPLGNVSINQIETSASPFVLDIVPAPPTQPVPQVVTMSAPDPVHPQVFPGYTGPPLFYGTNVPLMLLSLLNGKGF